MRFGLFSNGRRLGRTLGDAWGLDLDEIVLADRLGLHEAWISEHEVSADLLVARAAGVTTDIRLGSAVRVLPVYHPVQVVNDAAACDQLSGGRYLLGVGSGFRPEKLTQRGYEAADARAMTSEALDVVVRLLSDPEPFDHDGRFWRGRGLTAGLSFVQQPHPPLAVSVGDFANEARPASAVQAGQIGAHVLTPDFARPDKLRRIGDAMEHGRRLAGREPDRGGLRVCRLVYVAETDRRARDELRGSYEATLAYEIEHFPWLQADRVVAGGTLADLTFDGLVDTGALIVGDARTVTARIAELFDATGGFGTLLLHAGRDYATPERVAASLARFARDVAPAVAHLGTGRSATGTAPAPLGSAADR